MEQHIINLAGGVARNPEVQLHTPINFQLSENEHIAILGPNGAGKSLLIDTILGKFLLKEGRLTYNFQSSENPAPYQNIRYMAFRDTYGQADNNYYYQQRWNSTGQEDIPTVRQQLGDSYNEAHFEQLSGLFNFHSLVDKKVVHLSSGELRKFQLIKALLTNPRVLIMDNPFIGLDHHTRHLLTALLEELSTFEGLQLILVVSRKDDIPAFIKTIIPVTDRTPGNKLPDTALADINFPRPSEETLDELAARIASLPVKQTATDTSPEIIRLNSVTVRYGEKVILNNLDWTVHRGEKWALTGPNGSGKSTLLSLICADNPQSYASDISLFGRKRGTGESIWEIKKHIGYVSPEMHRAYKKNIPAIEIVASGLHDSIGLYKRPKPEETHICEWWMDIFGIAWLKDRSFLQLSSGEQRLVLLARAFVKDPELLILDEPLHGLDSANRKRVRRVIEAFSARPDKTLIMVTHYQEEFPSNMTGNFSLG